MTNTNQGSTLPRVTPQPENQPTTSPASSTKNTAARAGIIAMLSLGWLIQYALWVPMVYVGRFIKAAFSAVGAVGNLAIAIILLCIPIIGWIILILWSNDRNHKQARRQAERHNREQLEAIRAHDGAEPRSLWTPWGIGLVKADVHPGVD